jgi:predicted amidohydrolase
VAVAQDARTPSYHVGMYISFLHVSPETAAFERNLGIIEKGVRAAVSNGSSLVICPELCISGIAFANAIGLEWVALQPDNYVSSICDLAAELKVAVVLSHPERGCDGFVYNSALFISHEGELLACHRKMRVNSDRWSRAGQSAKVFLWNGIRIGMMICADAYTGDVARELAEQGAALLISPANWGPGLHGPAGEWEQRTLETRLPLLVCNRTGKESSMSFEKAESLVIKGGKKLLSHSSAVPMVLTFGWDCESMVPNTPTFSEHIL